MTRPLRLIIFDVDGTLVDSQDDITRAMTRAFEGVGAPVPPREAILGIVGLSLDVAMVRLAPDLDMAIHARMVDGYKAAYMSLRAEAGAAQSSPLYPGARDALETLNATPETLLGVATGKSRRGLDKLLEGHGLMHMFVTQQVADFHPSKPHPAMIEAALAETGVDARDAVMIGDTSYDMDMARAAGVAAIGVSWGYHPVSALAAADVVIDRFADLPRTLDSLWEVAT
ncbi:HAD-IA family hydrolase [Pseudohalocynthiibacter aestuariivivens]|uniref:HAD-IA family hydrolase n=1 Tax=Roseovarius pelagicus TaxID=2980108 RepID=A0ABY6DF77_9RHOB|nr:MULTISPECIES: HAD-IA family hydrolase [Rhodobacterales]QIE46661.1 HAD-IA family hydrolase [Pseudohalocynthiibacter aestuariivivens]UXX84806.1 HAD-IA family hydrolase [Roseovarius pelagicus]